MPSNADRRHYWRARRDAARGGPPRTPVPCGTRSAYLRHLRHNETPCAACRAANAEYQRTRRHRT
jgi:hypothetical protein